MYNFSTGVVYPAVISSSKCRQRRRKKQQKQKSL
jgi:hypothetical protein